MVSRLHEVNEISTNERSILIVHEYWFIVHKVTVLLRILQSGHVVSPAVFKPVTPAHKNNSTMHETKVCYKN